MLCIVFLKPDVFLKDQYCRVPHVEDGVNQEDGPRPVDDEQTPLISTIGQRRTYSFQTKAFAVNL